MKIEKTISITLTFPTGQQGTITEKWVAAKAAYLEAKAQLLAAFAAEREIIRSKCGQEINSLYFSAGVKGYENWIGLNKKEFLVLRAWWGQHCDIETPTPDKHWDVTLSRLQAAIASILAAEAAIRELFAAALEKDE